MNNLTYVSIQHLIPDLFAMVPMFSGRFTFEMSGFLSKSISARFDKINIKNSDLQCYGCYALNFPTPGC